MAPEVANGERVKKKYVYRVHGNENLFKCCNSSRTCSTWYCISLDFKAIYYGRPFAKLY